MGADTAMSVVDINAVNDDDPRVLDLRVAERLGMAQPLNIRTLIKANDNELKLYGEVFTRRVKTSARGGRPGKEYWLNEGQTLVLCMLGRTSQAAQVRKEVIEVFMAYRRNQIIQQTATPLRFGVPAGHHVVKAPDSDHYPFIMADLDLLVREAWEPIFDIWTPKSLLLAQHVHTKKRTVLWLTEHGGRVYRRVGHQLDTFNPDRWSVVGRVVGVCLSDGAVLPLAPELTSPDPARPAEPGVLVTGTETPFKPPSGYYLPIDRGIPVPEPLPCQRRYPFAAMQVGESFFAPGLTAKQIGSRLWSATNQTGFRFTSRTETDGVRVWRIE